MLTVENPDDTISFSVNQLIVKLMCRLSVKVSAIPPRGVETHLQWERATAVSPVDREAPSRAQVTTIWRVQSSLSESQLRFNNHNVDCSCKSNIPYLFLTTTYLVVYVNLQSDLEIIKICYSILCLLCLITWYDKGKTFLSEYTALMFPCPGIQGSSDRVSGDW